MDSHLFKIERLSCGYGGGNTVLHIESLDIPHGKLTFVLGISGVGKSTLIETLGLMNKTIKPSKECRVMFFPNHGEGIELANAWGHEDAYISKLRNKHFSFVFQNTNLMPNFTAGENICISQLIQGISWEKAKNKALNAMQQLNLPPDIFDRKVTELSGGQRQRLAFARAVTAEFNVLFGDEPTGNLDKDTAHKLMTGFKRMMAATQRSGIIVSHDIGSALDFADNIIFITPHPEGYGEVLPINTLKRQGQTWIRNEKTLNYQQAFEHICSTLGMETEGYQPNHVPIVNPAKNRQ